MKKEPHFHQRYLDFLGVSPLCLGRRQQKGKEFHLCLSEYLEKRLETDKLSHAEFCEIRNALCSAKIGEEFEKINLAATAKYGKAVND